MSNIRAFVIIFTLTLIGFITIGTISINTVKESLIESNKQHIATILNMATRQSAIYVNQYKKGVITKDEADEKIVNFLSALRYESSYVWANDNNAVARVHVRDKIIGQYQKSYTRDIDTINAKGLSYTIESNIKPLTNKRQMKINGIAKIAEWDWVVGYGVYYDDIDDLILKSITYLIASMVILILLQLAIALYFIKNKP